MTIRSRYIAYDVDKNYPGGYLRTYIIECLIHNKGSASSSGSYVHAVAEDCSSFVGFNTKTFHSAKFLSTDLPGFDYEPIEWKYFDKVLAPFILQLLIRGVELDSQFYMHVDKWTYNKTAFPRIFTSIQFIK